MAVSLTAGIFVAERQQGLLDRSLVAGTSYRILSRSRGKTLLSNSN